MSNTLDAVLGQYEKSKKGDSPKMSQTDRLKLYLTLMLPDNESAGSKRIRILPTTDGSSPFKEVYYHEMFIDGSWVKLYDPGKNDNERSPLNEVYQELNSTGKESDKELAKQYLSRLFYVVKVIDRDYPEHGPKFWRFKKNYKNEGILDKIIPIFKVRGDITNPENGRDLIINLVKSKNNKNKEYTTVSSILDGDKSPLCEDIELASKWINDPLTHRDVYAKKSVEYLIAIANGQTPKWNKDKNGWDYGDTSSNEFSIGGVSSDDLSSDDLPF